MTMTRPARTVDHHPAGTRYQRLNKWLAVKITNAVGSMTCAYLFALLALVSLPATLAGFAAFTNVFPKVLVNQHLIGLISWIAQTFFQLVLLSVIIVGQNISAAASDARAAKTFEDSEAIKAHAEYIRDQVDEHTDGGIKTVLDAIAALKESPHA